MRLYKSSANVLKLSSPAFNVSIDMADDDQSRMSLSERMSWEDDSLVRKGTSVLCYHLDVVLMTGQSAPAKSSLPVVRHAVRNETLSAANQLDRMTIWIRNVESECIG